MPKPVKQSTHKQQQQQNNLHLAHPIQQALQGSPENITDTGDDAGPDSSSQWIHDQVASGWIMMHTQEYRGDGSGPINKAKQQRHPIAEAPN